MRLLLRLSAGKGAHVSLNSNYALSSAIYNLLKFGSPEFSNFLHETGFVSNDKVYKLFTFSINYESTELFNGALRLKSPYAFLNISSPRVDDFIKNFVIGTFAKQNIEIYSEFIKTIFKIEQAELIPPPTYSKEMYFKLASPLVLSTHKTGNGHSQQYYFRYDDDINLINLGLEKNLMNKYEAITGSKYLGDGIKITWDDEYIKNAVSKGKRLSKKVSILKEFDNPIDIVGIFCPFNIAGDIELIKVGYECGFGEKNSMGFGMVI